MKRNKFFTYKIFEILGCITLQVLYDDGEFYYQTACTQSIRNFHAATSSSYKEGIVTNGQIIKWYQLDSVQGVI